MQTCQMLTADAILWFVWLLSVTLRSVTSEPQRSHWHPLNVVAVFCPSSDEKYWLELAGVAAVEEKTRSRHMLYCLTLSAAVPVTSTCHFLLSLSSICHHYQSLLPVSVIHLSHFYVSVVYLSFLPVTSCSLIGLPVISLYLFFWVQINEEIEVAYLAVSMVYQSHLLQSVNLLSPCSFHHILLFLWCTCYNVLSLCHR